MKSIVDVIKVKTFLCVKDEGIEYVADFSGGDYKRTNVAEPYSRGQILKEWNNECITPLVYFPETEQARIENGEVVIGVTGHNGIGNCPTGIEGLSVKENDTVNHPSHYTSGKIEVIDFIEDQKLGFCLGNTVKYVARAGKKDPSKLLEDLKKAKWYLEREIQSVINKKQEL